MPLITIRTTVERGGSDVTELLQECSHKLAQLTGKPEAYVMTVYERVGAMTMGGSTDAACLVEVRSIGKLSADQTRAMSEAFSRIVEQRLGVGARRIFLNFTDFSGAMWGHNGSTFG